MLVYVYASDSFDLEGEPHRVAKTVEMEGSHGQINIDYDEAGEIVGIELLDAQRITVEQD